MKLLIAGSRSIRTFDLSPYISSEVELIISGGADGIDTVAEEYAKKNKISSLVLYPQYRLYGKSAPLKRNEQMVEIADAVLVVWDGKSRGSKYTIEYAQKRKKNVTVLYFDHD